MMAKNRQFEPTPPLFGVTAGCDPTGILLRFLAAENHSSWAIIWHCLHDLTFSHFGTVPACDRQTHNDSIYHAGIAERGKNSP